RSRPPLRTIWALGAPARALAGRGVKQIVAAVAGLGARASAVGTGGLAVTARGVQAAAGTPPVQDAEVVATGVDTHGGLIVAARRGRGSIGAGCPVVMPARRRRTGHSTRRST